MSKPQPVSPYRPADASLLPPAGEQPWLEHLDVVRPHLERIGTMRHGTTGVLVLGMGGSAIGTRVLKYLLPHPAPIKVLDHLDPVVLRQQTDFALRPGTRVVVVSKSGNTLETILQYRYFRDVAGVSADRFLFIGDACDGWLQREARALNAPFFEVPAEVGGRFSVFTSVGLVPFALAGGDALGFLETVEAAAKEDLEFALGLAKDVLKSRELVLVSYRNELAPLAFWLQQLWAESLGKTLPDGSPSPFPLPAWCEGPRDQHALFQMFLEGAKDRLYLFLDLEADGDPLEVPVTGLGDLLPGVATPLRVDRALAACREGTAGALARRGHSTWRWLLGKEPKDVARFMVWCLDRTYRFAAHLGVDPHGQPAVEEGKRLTRKLLAEENGS